MLHLLNNEESFILNFFQQIGLTVDLSRAMKEPKLYKKYAKIFQLLPTFGFQAFGSVRIEDNPEFIYHEPYLHDKKVSLMNYLAYLRL